MNFSKKPGWSARSPYARVHAPRALVFSLWTDAKHLASWWGPHGFTNPRCEADPRPGGKILIHMQAPDGGVHPMGGSLHEIVPHERIVFTSFVELPDCSASWKCTTPCGSRSSGGKTKVTLQRAPAASRHGHPHARRHGGRLVEEPRQARRHLRRNRTATRMPPTRSRSAPCSATAPMRCSARWRISRSNISRADIVSYDLGAAAAACRHRQGRDPDMVRHLGRPDRLGDGRSRRRSRR